jgi:hypothetical protein
MRVTAWAVIAVIAGLLLASPAVSQSTPKGGSEVGHVRSGVESLRAELKSDMHTLRADVAADLLSTRKELADQIVGLRRAVINDPS